MSKFVKGVGKVFKKIVKGVVKVVKKVVKSKAFKVVLVAAAVYFGGVALGVWGGTGAAGAGTGLAAGTSAATAPALATGTEIASALTAAPTVAGTVAGTASTLAPALTAAAEIIGPIQAAAPAATAATQGGFFSSALNFMNNNQALTAMAFSGLSSALSPDEEDLIKAQTQSRRDRFAQLNDIGNLDLNLGSFKRELTDTSGVPWHQRLRGDISDA